MGGGVLCMGQSSSTPMVPEVANCKEIFCGELYNYISKIALGRNTKIQKKCFE